MKTLFNLFKIICIFLCLAPSFLLAQNIPRENVQAPNGLQVNTFTGNLFYQRADLFIPAPGLPIDISFYYNSSLRNEDIGYGQGWTFSYSMRYYFINAAQDSAVVEWPDGRRDVHANSNGSNEYQAVTHGLFYGFVQVQGGQFQLRTKDGMNYYFEDPLHRRLTRIEDPNGNTLSLNYNGSELTSITDAAGRNINLSWANGHLQKITDALDTPSREISFSYNSNNQLTQVQNPAGRISYTYGPDHELRSVSDENGNPAVIHYRSNVEAVSKIVSCAGDQVFQYDGERGKTYVFENGNNTTTFEYDDEGKLLRKYGSCCGFDLSYQYDADYNITQVRDGRDNAIRMEYDASGNMTKLTDPNQEELLMTYEPNFNRLSSLQDRRGANSIFSYDNKGNLTHIQRPGSIQESFSYDGQGNLTNYTDAEQTSTSFTYNSHGDLDQISYPLNQENFSYDGRGNLLSATDGNGNAVSFSYDNYDQLIGLTDPNGNQYAFGYNAAGDLIWEKDGNGDSVYYEYDPLNRLSAVINSAGRTQYHYDSQSNLIGITNANGNTTSFNYNNLNLVATEIDPMGFRTTYEYDPNGNLISKLDANGVTTSYSYDALNRLISRTYPEGSDHYEYDANGNLTRCYNNHIDYRFTHDNLNRLLSKTVQPWGKTISYTYDAVGNRTSMTDPDGGITIYQYDDNQRLTSLSNPFGQTTTFVYDNAGRMTRQNNANGTYAVYVYDMSDNLERLTHYKSNGDTLAFLVYTYDSVGYRTSMHDLQGLHTYRYDEVGRLVHVTYGNGDTGDYTYDGSGNRTSLIKNGRDTTLYGYDAEDKILFAGGTTFEFNRNGNMVEKVDGGDTTQYQYNNQDELTLILLSNGDSLIFQYDPTGLRISTLSTSDSTIKYLLDGPNVLQELDTDGNLTAQYTSGFGFDRWYGLMKHGDHYTYHQDGLNSILSLSDLRENEINSYRYDVFGKRNTLSGSIKNSIGFSGREQNSISELIYLRARYYSHSLGLFLSKDIFNGFILNPASLHKWAYTGSNPVNRIDPTGYVYVKIIVVTAKGIKAISRTHAVKLLRKNQAVRMIGGTAKKAKKLFKEAFPNARIKRDIPRTKGEYWHIQKKNGGGAKVKYGEKLNIVIPGSSLGKDIFGDNFAGNTFDFFNPLSDLQSIGEFFQDGNGQNSSGGEEGSDGSQEGSDPDRGGGQGNQDGSQPNPDDPSDGSTDERRPIDPNEFIAPAGYDSLAHWVSVNATLPYTILFENDPDSGATIAAQYVEIKHTLEPNTDPFSFRLKDFGFANFYFRIPYDTTSYQARLDVSDSLGVWVDVDFGIRIDSGYAYWRFWTIDPATGEITRDPEAGFLPVNDSITHRGEGFVNFTIKPKESSQTFDLIEPQAGIIFDSNDPVITPSVLNTIDADPPSVDVDDQVMAPDSNHIQISWTGMDMGAGVASYDVFYAQDEQAFVQWLNNTEANSGIFPAILGSEYCFIARASDHTGNVGTLSDSCDLKITFTEDLITSIEDTEGRKSNSQFQLGPNRPNPFNQQTIIPFELKNPALVRLRIYDFDGRLVNELLGDYLFPGTHQVIWNGTNSSKQQMPSGVYVYQILVNDQVGARRMILLR